MTSAGENGRTQRMALVVGDAVGPGETLGSVLARFGFAPPAHAEDFRAALDMLRATHFDLVLVPMQGMETMQLATLEREIRAAPSTFFIGTAPRPEPELILRAMRTGIHEFLVHPPDAAELAAAVDRLMRRSQSEGRRGLVLAVYSAKGGLGTTTIAVNLAHALAHNDPESRVALADLVVASGDVRVSLNLTPSYDMGSLLEKLDRVDAELLYSLLTPHASGVWVLPAPDSPELDDVLDATAVSAVIDHLRTHFAYTVLDCEHHLSERTLAALDAADRIVLVTQLSITALRATQRTLGICHRLGYRDEKLCVVVNRWQSQDVLSSTDAAGVLQHELFWKLPNDYRTAAAALTNGVPIMEYDASSKLAMSYQQLAARIGGASPARHRANGTTNGTGGSRLRRLLGMKKRS
ncbi:MAG TPA: hypothetical protein VFS44_11995 [Gemmatimonadaceae bacterium]|nr:hypothetical protein [Gemmatimonadaceae bacterium]